MTCHRQREVSPTGTVVWKATADNCLTCHDRQMTDTFEVHSKTLRDSLVGLDAALTRIRAALPDAKVSADRGQAIAKRLDDILHDVTFLRVGDGIHNIHYADHLTRTLVAPLTELCRELKIAPPEIALPEPLQREPATAEPQPLPSGESAAAETAAEPPAEAAGLLNTRRKPEQ
jgi:hypothetical protein